MAKRLIVIMVIMFLQECLFAACPSAACYVATATAGSANCSSLANACLMATAISNAAAGDHIYVNDGTYTGANSMIVISSKSGTSGNPITLSAINDGAVFIDGEGARDPVSLDASDYWIIEGINAAHGTSSTYDVIALNNGSDNNILRRVVAWDAVDDNSSVIGVHGGTNNLIEDCAAFGTGRKILSTSQGGNNTTFRRCWVQWNYSTSMAGPKTGIELTYTSEGNTCENCLLTWNEDSAPADPQSIAVSSAHPNDTGDPSSQADLQLLGSIVYLKTGSAFAGDYLARTGRYGGATIKDVAVYVPADQSTKGAGYFPDCQQYDGMGFSGACTGTINNFLTNVSLIGGAGSAIDAVWTQTNVDTASTVAGVYTGSNTLWVNDGTTGATICYRYIDRTLGTTPLWPFPMNQRIIDALTAASRTTHDVTAEMEAIFGTIPTDCRGGTPTFPLTLITHTSAGSSDKSNVTSSAIDTTGADLLTMEVAVYNDLPICTPSDSKSNAWTGLTAQGIVTDQRVRIYYSAHPTVGASHTFTCNGTNLAPSIAVQAWSGSATVPFDVQNGSTDTNVTGVRPGNVTPTADGALIVTAVSAAPITSALSIDSSFTKVDEVNFASGSHYGLSVGYKLLATPAVTNPTWTGDSSLNNWAADIAVFKSGTTYAGPAPSVFNSPVFRPRVFAKN